MYPDAQGKVYCHAINKIVELKYLFDNDMCQGCMYFAGTIQGEGVECAFHDKNAKTTPVYIYSPEDLLIGGSAV